MVIIVMSHGCHGVTNKLLFYWLNSPVDSHNKWPVMRKMSPYLIILTSSYRIISENGTVEFHEFLTMFAEEKMKKSKKQEAEDVKKAFKVHNKHKSKMIALVNTFLTTSLQHFIILQGILTHYVLKCVETLMFFKWNIKRRLSGTPFRVKGHRWRSAVMLQEIP